MRKDIDPETHLDRSLTFDSFIPCESNRFARVCSLAVARELGGQDFNPLCIYGGSGLGKTHLLNAIGNYALVKNPSLKVRYVTSEEFTNEFIDALQNPDQSQGQIAAFNKRYRQVDVLLIDDIQFLGGKEATLDQFFHTFNSLRQANKRIVIASDAAPKNLKGFEARLISRFESGLTVDVKPPDPETRIAILRLIASMNGSKIPNDVLDLIAERFTENIRELEDALTRVTSVASLSDQPVTRALAEQTLQDFFTIDVESKSNPPTSSDKSPNTCTVSERQYPHAPSVASAGACGDKIEQRPAERTSMRLGTIDLIRKIGLDPNDVVLIRHSTEITRKYVNQGFLDECTAEMKPKFASGQTHHYWMVFAGDQSTTRLVALYRMNGWTKLEKGMLPDDYPINESSYGRNDFYTLERLDLLSEYENRLTVDWGSFRTLAQNGTTDKPIVSIEWTQPAFPGFDNLILKFGELTDVIADPDYYSAYYDAMSQVNAIYLITDTKSGKQYVGSAYGGEGLWQRWSTYAHTRGRGGSGDGGNKLLVDLLNRGGEGYEKNLQYSVLRVLDSGLSTDQVVEMENLYKDKLGTREFGLNAN